MIQANATMDTSSSEDRSALGKRKDSPTELKDGAEYNYTNIQKIKEMIESMAKELAMSKEEAAKQKEEAAKQKEEADKKIARLEEEIAQQKEEIAKRDEAAARKEKEVAEDKVLTNIQFLAGKIYTKPLSEFQFDNDTRRLIDSIAIPEVLLQEFTHIVSEFNKKSRIIEESASIDDSDSVHNLWKQLLCCILKHFEKAISRKPVYEWGINNPVTQSSHMCNHAVAFSFIPKADGFLSWSNFCGGIELEKSYKNEATSGPSRKKHKASDASRAVDETINNTSQSYVESEGQERALSRAAMSIYERWEHAKREGSFRSYCFYADSRQLGITRVTLDGEKMQVIPEVLPPMSLPGYEESKDIFVLKLLVFLLTSDESKLDALMTPVESCPMQLMGDANWRLEACLGYGGYGSVFAHGTDCVIKVDHDIEYGGLLDKEATILQHLHAKKVTCVPTYVDKCVRDSTTIALKMAPIGIPLLGYIEYLGDDAGKILDLTKRMGKRILNIIREAHSAGVMHNDIRRANILIIPKNLNKELIGLYVEGLQDLQKRDAVYSEIVIEECDFLLNDWGLGTSDSNCEEYVEDLKALMRTVFQIKNVVDHSHSRPDVNEEEEIDIYRDLDIYMDDVDSVNAIVEMLTSRHSKDVRIK